MKRPVFIGIIGLGAIGSRLVEILSRNFQQEARVAFVCDLNGERAEDIQEKLVPRPKVVNWRQLVAHSDLIIEAASQEIAGRVAQRALKLNKQVLILSVGGLLSRNGVFSSLKRSRGGLWVPSGALVGVDGVLAAQQGRIKRVTLTTRKPIAGLEGAPYLDRKRMQLSRIYKPTVIFEGNALEAIRAFPKNVNVAATLALAAGGARKVRVRIVTSPTYRQNQHEVEIEGDFGTIRTEVKNVPSKTNPRTSELAVLSAAATLKKIFNRIRIGT